MENGGENFENKFAGLVLKDSNNNSAGNEALFQVMKAVEAAEVTIKQQEDENNQLRAVNRKLEQELEEYKSGQFKVQGLQLVNHLADGHLGGNQFAFGASFLPDRIQHLDNNSTLDNNFVPEFSNRTILHKDLVCNDEDLNMQRLEERNSDSCKANGMLNILAGGQAATDNLGFSQLSSPSTTSFSPNRYQTHGVFNPQSFSGQGLMPMTELNNSSNLNELFSSQLSLSGQGLMPVTELNNSSNLKQDLSVKIRDHEEEILRLRKHLGEYSMKEAQIRNEKFVLEKRIAYMRMAFDQQQQDLVDAASKAISYRQDIIEENIRLTYALQSAQQERSTFISSLMPLLAEYSFEPTVADAQSIASNMKVLFRHMQEKLLVTEAKLKESQYQLAPWRSDLNQSNFSPSPPHSSEIKNGLELVAQSQYSNQKMPLSSEPQTSTDWDLVEPSGLSSSDVKNAESDDLGRYPPLASRDTTSQDLSAHAVNPGEPNPTQTKDETTGKQVKFKDLVSSEMEESELEGQQNDRESSVNWSSKSMGYTATIEDPSTSYSPYLPPVLEEPSSSFSEAGDEDPLPAIKGLQISGEAFPGRELQACGFSINGTTSCNFEWVRHMEDGSFNYIDGAKQPNYDVTADDVDAYLAIEVQPLDNRKRKGELVKVFANGHRKISCDQEMQNCIEKTFYGGHASYKLFLSRGYLDIWEPATLGIKRDGYSIKCSGSSGMVVSEKFSPSTIVSLPYGSLIEFSIIDGQGIERLLRTENGSNDISCSRDTIVLTLRLFISRFNEKKKGKKRGLFFNK